MIVKRQVNAVGFAALARYDLERAKSCSVKKFEVERVAHARAGGGARAPSTNWLVPDQIDFLAKAIARQYLPNRGGGGPRPKLFPHFGLNHPELLTAIRRGKAQDSLSL